MGSVARMNLTPEQLPARGYELHEVLHHDALIPFVQRALRARTVATAAYWALNLGAGVAVALALWNDPRPLGDALARLGLGVAAAFLLVPLHEGLHAWAYRGLGARQTSFDMNLRHFYFVAMADRFVASTREFVLVALAPFAVISALGLLALALVPPAWSSFVLGLLVTHTAFCSGDFALLSYFEQHRRRQLVTFDDRAGRQTTFWRRVEAPPQLQVSVLANAPTGDAPLAE